MSFKKAIVCCWLTLLQIPLLSLPGYCQDVSEAPVALQAALFLKLLPFDKNIVSTGAVTIYVVDAPEFAAEMKKAEGKLIGAAALSKVIDGKGVPAEKPSVIYVGSESVLKELVAYTRENKILSISGKPELASKEISLFVGISSEKPKILLNLSASKEEGIDWNPAILKVAATIK
jgi:YfiR/HmsC-like